MAMYSVAINQMPFKVPSACIFLISIALAALHLTNTLPLSFTLPPHRLLCLIAAYLVMMSAIIFMQLQMIRQNLVHMKSSERRPCDEYEKVKREETKAKVL